MASKTKKSIPKSVSTAKEHRESPLFHSKRAQRNTAAAFSGTSEDAAASRALYTSQSNQNDIAALAYHLWQARGRPEGSPEEDWFQAERELAS